MTIEDMHSIISNRNEAYNLMHDLSMVSFYFGLTLLVASIVILFLIKFFFRLDFPFWLRKEDKSEACSPAYIMMAVSIMILFLSSFFLFVYYDSRKDVKDIIIYSDQWRETISEPYNEKIYAELLEDYRKKYPNSPIWTQNREIQMNSDSK